ncbi:MAG: hypothetical protein PHT32_08235, partial [Candidatus Omnitrophica bacterium]|nr:hypothetical protein [Candidatus Omnitrophota bacterium]
MAPVIADLGSAAAVAGLHIAIRGGIAIFTSMLSFAGLWGEVYLITGIILDSLQRKSPSRTTIFTNITTGMRKGVVYTAIFMAMLFLLKMLLDYPPAQKCIAALPMLLGIAAGALVFPLLKTIVETFDGSQSFFERMRYSYRDMTLALRGGIVGFGGYYMISNDLFQKNMPERILFGLVIGFLASGGVSIVRDVYYAVRKQGKIQSWKLYLIDSLLGAFVGSAAAFYLDARQVPVVIEKFKLYTSMGLPEVQYITYPLINKWGRIDLGTYAGGSKLLFIESLAGVINWAVAAWLFAVNKVFMEAYFQKDKTPIRFFFSAAGFVELMKHMLYVLRWGLWMSPIIFTFLRMMPDPTWYNQDGAIRTIFAIYNNITMSPSAFNAWSLQVFIYILAFDFFRVLIWMDHMGLRVATLVNLSFIGLDKLDEKIARFIGPAAAQRYIPEAVKRFATWAPLLIPFYLPRGQAWDYAWNTAEAMRSSGRGKAFFAGMQSMPLYQTIGLITLAVLACATASYFMRALHRRNLRRHEKSYELGNREYKVVLKESGEIFSEVVHKEYDISRRSYDIMDPCGRVLYLAEAAETPGSPNKYWPVIGNFPKNKFEASHIEKKDNSVTIINESNNIKTTIDIKLPDLDTTAEIWTVTIDNLSDKARQLKVVPYLEWVLNGGMHDRFHTQYARLYPEMEYASAGNAVLSWHKGTKAMGILASDTPPSGFLTSRADFIGRARSIWSPRILETLKFQEAADSASYPTFDPIGSLILNLDLEAYGSKTIRFMIGYSKNRETALKMIGDLLKPQAARSHSPSQAKTRSPLIGHGEIPPGTPQPYYQYSDKGNKLIVRTPFTPRPYDHALSNTIHSVMVTNRGLHTSCNGNSQQNRVTPDWPDTVTKEIPGEAIYLFDADKNEWYSPTYHPLNDSRANNEAEFGVDGTALFRMTRGNISTELTVFVPTEDPMGIYLLTVKNSSDKPKKIRIAPYFQIALAFQPEKSGTLTERYDKELNTLFFENPRNLFRAGWAFATMSIPSDIT